MKNLIFFDTETTQKDNARLVQIATAINDGEIYCQLFKPAEIISIEAMEIHGITNEEVDGLEPFSQYAQACQSVFDDGIAIAHNAKFDIGVMKREEVNIETYIDTLQVAKHLLPNLPAHRLQYLRYALKLQMPETNLTAHDAAGDVAVLRALFNHLLTMIKTNGLIEQSQLTDKTLEEAAIDKMIELTKWKISLVTMPFGKYKDRKFEEIVKTDRNYLVWLSNQSDLSEDLAFTLKQILN